MSSELVLQLEHAYRAACEVELTALKPGNISQQADRDSAILHDFQTSARISAHSMAASGLELGERIYQAVAATRSAVNHNTNLGIILLCAPIAQAWHIGGVQAGNALRKNLVTVLETTTVKDASWAYRAIRVAQPGGIGEVDAEDVEHEPQVSLLEAMRLAAERDRVAYQYASGYIEIFETTLPQLKYFLNRGFSCGQAITGVFLNYLAQVPDSLIARKFGLLQARSISDMIAPLAAQYSDSRAPGEFFERLMSIDGHLKRLGINPGTTADIMVVTLFLAQLERVI